MDSRMSLLLVTRSLVTFLLCASSTAAFAEYCWMLGCRNEIGYVPVHTSPVEPRKSLFVGAALPKVGRNAVLAEYVNLRRQAIDGGEAPFLLGPGTVVKVLEYVDAGRKYAIVRVVRDRNDRREECTSAANCSPTIY